VTCKPRCYLVLSARCIEADFLFFMYRGQPVINKLKILGATARNLVAWGSSASDLRTPSLILFFQLHLGFSNDLSEEITYVDRQKNGHGRPIIASFYSLLRTHTHQVFCVMSAKVSAKSPSFRVARIHGSKFSNRQTCQVKARSCLWQDSERKQLLRLFKWMELIFPSRNISYVIRIQSRGNDMP